MDTWITELRLDIFQTIMQARDTVSPQEAADMAVAVAERLAGRNESTRAKAYNEFIAEVARALS